MRSDDNHSTIPVPALSSCSVAHVLEYRWLDAPPFTPFGRGPSSRERFPQIVWVLGTKLVRQKTDDNLGRIRRTSNGDLIRPFQLIHLSAEEKVTFSSADK